MNTDTNTHTSNLDTKEFVAADVEPTVEGEVFYVSPEDDARVRRKFDMILMPMLTISIGFQFLDKLCMAYASVMGFRTDIGLSLSQYSWLGSIVFLGFLVGEYPIIWLMQRWSVTYVTGICTVLWGLSLALMAVGSTFSHMMVLRFFLGFFEACVTPACTTYMARFYKQREQGARTGVWMSANSFGTIIGASMAYGLYEADIKGNLPLSGWKMIYIILGVVTIAFGIAWFFIVPETPGTARFLSAADQKIAVERLRSTHQGVVNHKFNWKQFREAFTDPLTWVYVVFACASMIPNGGITSFLSILIQGFGFSTTDTLLLGMVNAYHGIVYVFFLWLGDKIKRRCLIAVVCSTISSFGLALMWGLPASMRIGRLAGFYLCFPFATSYAISLALLTSNIAGNTKKSTATGLFFVAYCVGNLIGPQTFRAQYAPQYVPALATIIVCNTIVSIGMLGLHFWYKKENDRRDRIQAEGTAPDMSDWHFQDMTDRENVAFRYAR